MGTVIVYIMIIMGTVIVFIIIIMGTVIVYIMIIMGTLIVYIITIDVTRNSVLNGKTQLIEAVQTKVFYFILLKITYRITNWTPYRHCIG